VVFLTGNYAGTMDALADEFVTTIGGRRVVYDPYADLPRDADFTDADFLIAFGADFLETWGSPVDYAWQFSQMHGYRNGRRGKFVWVGPHRPLTGLNADQWIAPRPGTEALVALGMTGAADLQTVSQQTGIEPAVIQQLAQEFRAGRGVALGPGPALTGRNGGELRQAVATLNGTGGAQAPGAGTDLRQMILLTEQMRRGEIEVLLVDAPNPAYTLPGALNFAEAMRGVRTRVSFATFPDDSSQLCNFVLPNHHFLEAWDDYLSRTGVLSLVQPAMRPVFNTKQIGDVLLSVMAHLGQMGGAAAATGATTYYDYLRARWQGQAGGDLAWREAIQRGGAFAAAAGVAGLPVGRGAPRGAESGFGAPGLPAVQPGQAGQQAPALQQPAPGVQQQPFADDTTGMAAPLQATAQPDVPPTPGASRFEPLQFEGAEDANFHLLVYPSYRFFDGRTANRPWLLELPDPVTKISWDSWVEMHPRAAEELGVGHGQMVEITSPYGSLRAPVFVYPGVRPDTVAIQTGLGHTAFGRYTEGRGVNPNLLLGPAFDDATGAAAAYGLRVRVQPTGEKFPLFEQGVRIQHDREIGQAVSLAALVQRDQTGPGIIPGEDKPVASLRKYGGFGPVTTLTDPGAYPPPGTQYGQYVENNTRWAMVIDLQRCIGCSACVIACNAENNIPVVGPHEMRKGRELHWLRIERYWGVTRNRDEAYTDQATDDTRFVPMLCQHCGNAPCEPVCPVYAAYHTPDGLNAQVYNRCVGTRYCANNCPYKVRVFNWFAYEFAPPLNWQLNPDVSVRDKGVMEKCTFCVQRIHEARRNAALEGRYIQDGEVVPACVQTCPTEVYTFGDISDPNSTVAQAARSNRSYRVLGELNVQKVTLHEPRNSSHEAPAGTGYGPPEGAAPGAVPGTH
jgi:molybdopterin-containing oxidoreductase family iron-sulfur binding subunit